MDVRATAAVLLGVAVVTLVTVGDVRAGSTVQFSITGRTQIRVVNVRTTAALLSGFAIGPLITVTDAGAPGKRVSAEHQQHRKH